MTSALILGVAFAAIGSVLCGRIANRSGDGNAVGLLVASGLLGGLAVSAAIVVTTIAAVSYLDRTYCEALARETGRETKFARYTYLSWDCLTPADGRWVPIDNLRAQEDR